MRRIGYLKLKQSSYNRKEHTQLLNSLKLDRLYIDCINDSELQKQLLLRHMRPNDIVVVRSLDSLANSTSELLSILTEMFKAKVNFKSINERIDTSLLTGDKLVNLILSLKYFDTHQIKPDTSALSKVKGRPKVAYDRELFDTLYPRWKQGDITAREMMSELNLKSNTFYRIITSYEK